MELDSSEIATGCYCIFDSPVDARHLDPACFDQNKSLTPEKPKIPRLELLAALKLPRVAVRVKEALQPVAQVNEVSYWTDSMTTLHWINGSDKEYKQFV